jgi:alkanesulfonate monooxygenase SsuD/methylene tetrahydromethanopterin reductase-like flavin-dependent oxidoreductase (luciferase family)
VTLDAPPYRLDRAVMEPGPVHTGGPKLWLGGQGPRGLRLAARYADGWNYASNLGGTLEGFVERRDLLFAACDAIGRDPATLTLSVQIIIPPDGEPRRSAFERAVAYGRAGASVIILTTLAREGAPGIRRLAVEVAEPLKAAFA